MIFAWVGYYFHLGIIKKAWFFKKKNFDYLVLNVVIKGKSH